MIARATTADRQVDASSRSDAGAPACVPRELLERAGLRFERAISDDGDSFVTAFCRDRAGSPVVLKYVRSRSADALRRLKNETQLVKNLEVTAPLRLLPHRSDGPGYLITAFDGGLLLQPDSFDEATVRTVADALRQLQSIRPDFSRLGIVDREPIVAYYLKVLLKNLLHLWPTALTATEAVRCFTIVTRALPAITRRRVICHGDFLPTNLLYHAEDGSVTFSDLEGFICGNHMLFDVLAFFSISGLELAQWEWQRQFLARFLAGAADVDVRSKEYYEAYRGILVFFLVYRLNEARLALAGTTYFNGQPKGRFLLRKAVGLATRDGWRDESAKALVVRARNLRTVLSRRGFVQHFETMHSAVTPAC